MQGFTDFLAMGGYGAYVWPVYGIAALVLIVLLAATLRGLRAREVQARRLDADHPRRGARPGVKDK
ncbi:MAG: heme exporter protein CcmD [Alphaproteobacteria bacterium]